LKSFSKNIKIVLIKKKIIKLILIQFFIDQLYAYFYINFIIDSTPLT